jgi:hypothetical protein
MHGDLATVETDLSVGPAPSVADPAPATIMPAVKKVLRHRVILVEAEVTDDGFDGGAPAHLVADGRGDTPDLAADPDLEPVRIVVAAIALVAVDAADRDTCKLFEIGDDGAGAIPDLPQDADYVDASRGTARTPPNPWRLEVRCYRTGPNLSTYQWC